MAHNQQSEAIFIQENSGSAPMYIICQNSNCNPSARGITKIQPKTNLLNCLFCFCCSPLWFTCKLYRAKDFNCTDVEHSCLKCGGYVAKYEAC